MNSLKDVRYGKGLREEIGRGMVMYYENAISAVTCTTLRSTSHNRFKLSTNGPLPGSSTVSCGLCSCLPAALLFVSLGV
jgi:hypothetical protein